MDKQFMRLEKFRRKMEKIELDGFLVTQPHNRRYLSGFTGSNGVLIITKDKQALATDFRYYEQARRQCPDWELIEVGGVFTEKMLEMLRKMGLGGRRVGFEPADLRVSTLLKWEQALEGRLVLVHTENFVEELRMQKDEGELAGLKKAIALADEAYRRIAAWLQPGLTERQIAWELEVYMRAHGAEALSFEPVVASGPNSALPHAKPSGRIIQKGEPITMDFGCVVGGYCSDLTRTVCLGQPADEQYLTVWNKVLEAQEAALTGAKAGMTGVEVDALARDVINAAGHKEHFGHSLGHSVGLFIHEAPRFSFLYDEKIPAGAVVTVEPGIYIPGWGGVRIEDIVLVNEDGVEVLTTAPKEAVLPI